MLFKRKNANGSGPHDELLSGLLALLLTVCVVFFIAAQWASLAAATTLGIALPILMLAVCLNFIWNHAGEAANDVQALSAQAGTTAKLGEALGHGLEQEASNEVKGSHAGPFFSEANEAEVDPSKLQDLAGQSPVAAV